MGRESISRVRPESFERHWSAIFCVVNAKINQSHAAGKARFFTRALHPALGGTVDDEGAGRIDGHGFKLAWGLLLKKYHHLK
jgi:hypothetical protein